MNAPIDRSIFAAEALRHGCVIIPYQIIFKIRSLEEDIDEQKRQRFKSSRLQRSDYHGRMATLYHMRTYPHLTMMLRSLGLSSPRG